MNDIIKAYLEEYEIDLKNCEKEIDDLYKKLEIYNTALSMACLMIASFPPIPRTFSVMPRAQRIKNNLLAAAEKPTDLKKEEPKNEKNF